MPSKLAMDPTLRAAGIIGFWRTNVPAASSILDEGAAEMMAGNVELAGKPVSLEVALSRTHPEDQAWVFDRIRRVRQTGGPVSTEFRVLTNDGEVRWVLVQGQLMPDDNGVMHGRGAYIDTTAHHNSVFYPPHPDDPSFDEDHLVLAADRALETHEAIARTGYPSLRRLSELMLFELGQILGRSRRA